MTFNQKDFMVPLTVVLRCHSLNFTSQAPSFLAYRKLWLLTAYYLLSAYLLPSCSRAWIDVRYGSDSDHYHASGCGQYVYNESQSTRTCAKVFSNFELSTTFARAIAQMSVQLSNLHACVIKVGQRTGIKRILPYHLRL